MVLRWISIGLVACALLAAGALAPATATAASAADCQPAGGQTNTFAAGDDPALTPPATPTCDDGGYDLDFPDAPLETDAPPAAQAPAVEGGGTAADIAPVATAPFPTGALPVTGSPDELVLMLLFGLLFLSAGTLLRLLVALRDELSSAHA